MGRRTPAGLERRAGPSRSSIAGTDGRIALAGLLCRSSAWSPPASRRWIKEQGLAPGRLELEINQSVLIRNSVPTLVELRRRKALGVRIAMADFGTGYSRLSYLHRFPFDKIKQSFTRALGTDTDSSAVVCAVIGLGKSLGIPVIAEGVETAEQLELLRQEDCDQVRLPDRPVDAARAAGVSACRGQHAGAAGAGAAQASRQS